MLGAEALEGVVEMRERSILPSKPCRNTKAAGKGQFISPRLNSAFEGGWMRMMFAADYVAGYAATKVFGMIDDVGVRYVVSLYRLADGEIARRAGWTFDHRAHGCGEWCDRACFKIRRTYHAPADRRRSSVAHAARGPWRAVLASNQRPSPDRLPKIAGTSGAADVVKLGIPVKAEATAEAATRGHKVVVAATSFAE